MSSVSDYVKSKATSSISLETLPLMHSCDGFAATSIIHDKTINVCECPVFHEKLLYFFYGRPAYKVSERVKGNRPGHLYLPVCFIVPFKEVKPHRIFPFDTGAFDAKMYNKFLHHKMKIDEFELENTLEEVKQYIHVFYDNNINYIRGVASSVKDSGDDYVDGLISIHNFTGEEEIDGRANTVEVIADKGVNVHDAVECIILPEPLSRAPKIQPFIKNNPQIDFRLYDVPLLCAPSEFNAVVYQKVMDYFREKNVI